MADASGSGEYLGILWAELPVYILILLGWVIARGRVMDPKLSLPPLNTCALACLAVLEPRVRLAGVTTSGHAGGTRTDTRSRPRPRAGF